MAKPIKPGAYGDDQYGVSPYGGDYPPFGLESAEALSATRVRLRYTAMFDAEFDALHDIFNYSIEPALQVLAVEIESAQSVILTTEAQTAAAYTVTIQQARGYFGQPLSPSLAQQQFTKALAPASFYAVATRDTRVRVVFSEPMQQNPELTSPAQYVLVELDGDPVSIARVVLEQTSSVRSVVLELAGVLADEQHYRLTVLSGVLTEAPDTVVFQWVWNPLVTVVPASSFSGEVQDYSFGINTPPDDPDQLRYEGLVWFSPALLQSAANSVIEVKEVTACSRAYDEYHFPEQPGDPVNPWPLMTHGAGVVPTTRVTTLNSGDVLWVGGQGSTLGGSSWVVATLSGPAGTVVRVLGPA